MTQAGAGLIERLLRAMPGLRAEFDARQAEYLAEGLADDAPQLFLSEHTAALHQRHRAGDPGAAADLQNLAAFLEGEIGFDPDVDHLIDVGFLAFVPDRQGPDGAGPGGVVPLLGPRLGGELDRQRDHRLTPAQQAFLDRLTSAVPALRSLADANRYGTHGSVLLHPFLAEVVFREVERWRSGEPSAVDEARAVFALAEAEFGRDREVDEPLAASFVENLPYPHEAGADVVGLLGPRLSAELARQRPSATAR